MNVLGTDLHQCCSIGCTSSDPHGLYLGCDQLPFEKLRERRRNDTKIHGYASRPWRQEKRRNLSSFWLLIRRTLIDRLSSEKTSARRFQQALAESTLICGLLVHAKPHHMNYHSFVCPARLWVTKVWPALPSTYRQSDNERHAITYTRAIQWLAPGFDCGVSLNFESCGRL